MPGRRPLILRDPSVDPPRLRTDILAANRQRRKAVSPCIRGFHLQIRRKVECQRADSNRWPAHYECALAPSPLFPSVSETASSAVFTFSAFLGVPWCSPGLLSRLLSNYVPDTSLKAQNRRRAGSVRTICGGYLRGWSRRLTYSRWPVLVSTALSVGKRGVRGTVWRDGHTDSLRAPGFP